MDVSKYNQIAEKLKPQKQVKKHTFFWFFICLAYICRQDECISIHRQTEEECRCPRRIRATVA